MTPRARWLILAFALAGLVFAGASTWVHYRLLTDPTYASPCDISSTFNCTQVLLSRFGSVQGVPVAVGGMTWFGLVALIAGLGGRTTKAETASPAGSYVFALATIGLAVVLYLGYASFFILRTWCVLCLGTYVSVIGIFIVSGLTSSIAMTRLPARVMSDLKAVTASPVLLLVGILYLAGAASAIAFFPKEPGSGPTPAQQNAPAADAQQAFADAWFQQPRIDLGIPADGASVIVVKFNDFLCSACKMSHLAYEPVFEKYKKSHPGAVRQVLKDWPWNARCNFNGASIQGHEASCEAAAAVRMAADRGKADEMIAWVFAEQQKLIELGLRGAGAPEAVKAKAVAMLGITPADFDREYSAKVDAIRRDVADGGALRVQQTPTYYVNGVKAVANNTFLPTEYFDLAIKLELQKAGKY